MKSGRNKFSLSPVPAVQRRVDCCSGTTFFSQLCFGELEFLDTAGLKLVTFRLVVRSLIH
jgi:hypothetical protein